MIFDQVRLKPYFIRAKRCFEAIFDDFINVKSDKNVDFSMFCRTHDRTQNGGRGMGRTDMPLLASGDLL